MSSGGDIFWCCLKENLIEAYVVDIDYHVGMLTVKTDYIISVSTKNTTTKNKNDNDSSAAATFAPFKINKRYQSFRVLAQALSKTTEAQAERSVVFASNSNNNKKGENNNKTSGRTSKQLLFALIQYANSIEELIESQSREYIGKVSMSYVKKLSNQRCNVINQVLKLMLSFAPPKSSTSTKTTILEKEVLDILQDFFLTDHVPATGSGEENNSEEISISSRQRFRITSIIKKKIVPALTLKKRKHGKNSQTTTISSSNNNNAADSTTTTTTADTISTKHNISDSKLDEEESRNLIMHSDTIDDCIASDDDNDDDYNSNVTKSTENHNSITVAATRGNNRILNSFERNPILIGGMSFIGLLVLLKVASSIPITFHLDIALLLAFAFYCLGIHTVAAATTTKTTTAASDISSIQRNPNRRVAMSLASRKKGFSAFLKMSSPVAKGGQNFKDLHHDSDEEANNNSNNNNCMNNDFDDNNNDHDHDNLIIKSPFPMYPKDGKKHLNCWSMPDASNFKVRGPNYTTDKKKVSSDNFHFPARGMDLFLTDAAPENIGQNPAILGGKLRTKSTLVFNFRLPWGSVILYFEIPDKFLPFVWSRYENNTSDVVEMQQKQQQLLDSMTPSERCVANFLRADDATKNNLLKIVPVVVEGPWIVRSVVSGKPAIIGQKLPVTYIYDPPPPTANSTSSCCYLELDLDVVSSAAARSILSVVRGYTQDLTMDLGFVIQGNTTSELPEQMLCAIRVHGIDIFSASPLPHPNIIMNIDSTTSSDDEEED